MARGVHVVVTVPAGRRVLVTDGASKIGRTVACTLDPIDTVAPSPLGRDDGTPDVATAEVLDPPPLGRLHEPEDVAAAVLFLLGTPPGSAPGSRSL